MDRRTDIEQMELSCCSLHWTEILFCLDCEYIAFFSYFRIKMVICRRLKLQIYSVHATLCRGVQK